MPKKLSLVDKIKIGWLLKKTYSKVVKYLKEEGGKPMLKKFMSRKFLIIVISAIVNILVITGVIGSDIAQELQHKLVEVITALGGVYVIVEGIIDMLRKK